MKTIRTMKEKERRGKNNSMDFDSAAKAWDDKPERRARAAAAAAAIAAHLPADCRRLTAVELGCGTGLLSFHLAYRFLKIHLVDSSDGMLSVLQDKIRVAGLKNMFPRKADIDDLPLTDFTCDVIYSLLALHHVPDHLRLLSRCYALLNRPGRLFIADLDAEDGSFHEPDHGFTGHPGFERETLKRDLGKIGFQDIEAGTIQELTKNRNGVVKRYPLFLCKAEKPSLFLGA